MKREPKSLLRSALDVARRLLGDLRGRALLIVLGCFVCQLGLGFGYVFGPLAKPILEDLGWSRSDFSAARLIQLFVPAAVSPLIGWLVLKLGARRVLLVSIVTMAMAFVGFSQMKSLGHYYALAALMGLALAGVGDVSAGHMVSEWVKVRRGLALGLVYAGSNAAGFGLIPLTVALAESTTWRSSLLAVGGVGFAMAPIAAFTLRERLASSSARRAQAAEPDPALGDDRSLTLSEALRTRSFWILAVSLFTFFLFFLGLLEHLVLHLTDRGMALADASTKLQTAIGVGLVSKIAVGALADHLPARISILADYALLTAASAALLIEPSPVAVGFFAYAFGTSTAARDVVYPLAVIDCFGARNLASIYGALMLALLPGGLGPWVAAQFHDRLGSYDAVFALFALLNAISFLALLGLRDERPRALANRPMLA